MSVKFIFFTFTRRLSLKYLFVHENEAVSKEKNPDVSPVNISGSSWRIRALRKGLRRNITYVSPSCQALHE